jgi:intracellular septation protein A
MKSVYKLLIDIGPLAVFFIFYTRSGLQEAILPLMIATVISVIISYT